MARAQDAQTVTGGQIDPYAQQALMQNKQLANNRIVTAMQDEGATRRQQMSGKQQMQQQKLAGQQQMQQTAAQVAAADRRAAEVERGRREDQAERKRQFQETQQLTSRLADRQFEFEKAVDQRDYATAERAHKQIRADKIVADRVSAELARADMKLIVAKFAYGENKELAKEKLTTAITKMKNEADELRSAFEKDKPRFTENFLADKRFEIFRTAGEKYAEVGEGPATYLYHRAMPLLTGERKAKSTSVQDAIQRQASGNGSGIYLADLAAAGYASLETKVASGIVKEKDIRMMYTTLESAKDAIRSKMMDASDRETREWNTELMKIDSYEATLARLRSSTEKIKGDDNRSVGTVARTGLDTVQGTGIPGMMDLISESSATEEERTKNLISEMQKSMVPGSALPTQEGDDEFVIERTNEVNIGRGVDISKPTNQIGGEVPAVTGEK